MKQKHNLGSYILVAISLLLFACGTTQTAAEKADKAKHLREKIESFNFKFNATYAHPQNYKSVYLSSYYDVKVSPDTVKAYLPFFGRAYTAPMNSREGGIKFESTDFEYIIEEGKKDGRWQITINTKDTPSVMSI